MRGGLDKFYYYYFLLHIPITVIIDSCLVIPPAKRLAFQQWIYTFHVTNNKDYLLINPPNWLYYFGLVELVFQLPFFVAAVRRYNGHGFPGLSKWIALYGLNASFTTLCCLADIWAHGPQNGLSNKEMVSLLGVYLPTFLIPLVMVLDYVTR